MSSARKRDGCIFCLLFTCVLFSPQIFVVCPGERVEFHAVPATRIGGGRGKNRGHLQPDRISYVPRRTHKR